MACLLTPVAGQLVHNFFNGAGCGFGATADAPLGGADANFDATDSCLRAAFNAMRCRLGAALDGGDRAVDRRRLVSQRRQAERGEQGGEDHGTWAVHGQN